MTHCPLQYKLMGCHGIYSRPWWLRSWWWMMPSFKIWISRGSVQFGHDFIDCLDSDLLLRPFHKELIIWEKMSLDICQRCNCYSTDYLSVPGILQPSNNELPKAKSRAISFNARLISDALSRQSHFLIFVPGSICPQFITKVKLLQLVSIQERTSLNVILSLKMFLTCWLPTVLLTFLRLKEILLFHR